MEGYISEIRMFGPVWAPRNWLLCQNQLLAISSNTALFSLIGTLYGGDGRTTFALPDLRGRAAIGSGNGPGLTPRVNGQKGGQETHTLNITEMPLHNHSVIKSGSVSASFHANSGGGTAASPTNGATLAGESAPSSFFYNTNTPDVTLNPASVTVQDTQNFTVGNNGGNLSHNNMQPWACVAYIICQFGIFPSRS